MTLLVVLTLIASARFAEPGFTGTPDELTRQKPVFDLFPAT